MQKFFRFSKFLTTPRICIDFVRFASTMKMFHIMQYLLYTLPSAKSQWSKHHFHFLERVVISSPSLPAISGTDA